MKLIEVYAKIKSLKHAIFQTRDVAALLNISISAASKSLGRLAAERHVLQLGFGLWGLPDVVNGLMLPEYLTAPFPSYVSLQSALYYYGMIEQIPQVVYAVSLARTKRFDTPLGTISIHHIAPDFYFGYTVLEEKDVKIAVPEKALLDFLYLSPTKSGWFAATPELELPPQFDPKLCQKWINKILNPRRRALVKNRFDDILQRYG